MSTYAVGDLQGCIKPLLCLLEKVSFNPHQDRLWCAGDIVNRGPHSLDTLRYIYQLGDACTIVLGNHDLHLLAIAYGNAILKPSDTLQGILNADDAPILLDWLRHQPLLYQERGYTLVHAGIPPQWSIQQAQALAKEVEAVLQSDDHIDYFENMYGNKPKTWSDELVGSDRLRVITNYLTRMRFCSPTGKLDLKNKGSIESADNNTMPWFEVPGRLTENDRIIFGHWASLQGISNVNNVFALDTGCVWGGQLTMMRLEDQLMFSCDC